MMLVERARAKINLTLSITGRRRDGYHLLDSFVAFAGCGDRLDLDPGPALVLNINGPMAHLCGAGDDNLVLKAARLLHERIPDLNMGTFTLHKSLPVAAGIGGGSADAAAALRLLAKLNGIAPDDPRLLAAALKAGADVPVCVGSHSARMSGIGEALAPVALPRVPAVLVNPRVAVSTRDIFAALNVQADAALPNATGEALAHASTCASVTDLAHHLARAPNDLEPVARRLQPVIGDVLEALRITEQCALARMSGSGATCFALYPNARAALRAAHHLRRVYPGWWVRATGIGENRR